MIHGIRNGGCLERMCNTTLLLHKGLPFPAVMMDLNMMARTQSQWEDFLEMVGLMTVKVWECGGEKAVIDAIFDHQRHSMISPLLS